MIQQDSLSLHVLTEYRVTGRCSRSVGLVSFRYCVPVATPRGCIHHLFRTALKRYRICSDKDMEFGSDKLLHLVRRIVVASDASLGVEII